MSPVEKTYKSKVVVAIFYFALGTAFLVFRHNFTLINVITNLIQLKISLWCIGWASIGIGAG